MASSQIFSMIIQSDNYERVHSALVLASAALATGKTVNLFFTMSGTQILTPGWAPIDQEETFRKKGMATFETLIDACNKMNARFMVCEMGLLSVNLKASNLREDIKIREGSAVSFISEVSDTGAVLYI